MFPEVPACLIENVACDGQWNADRLPWNRRKRRAIEKAKFVVLHLYSGNDDKTWKQLERQSHGVEVIQVELKKGADMRNNDLMAYLEELARAGRIHQVLAGPPCRTVSMCRFRSVAQADRGPRPLRGRYGQLRFGPMQSRTRSTTIQFCGLGCSNWWSWPRTTTAEQWWWLNSRKIRWTTGPMMRSCTKDMGFQPFCNGRRRYKWSKTTTLRRSRWIGEAWGILQLSRQLCSPTSTRSRGSIDGRCMANLKKWPQELEKRIQFSKELATWATGLKGLLRMAIQRLSQEETMVKALTLKEQKEIIEWKERFRADHPPFCKDCDAAGADRHRKRLQCPTSFCLSMDIMGPFVQGKDQELKGPSFGLAAAYTVPIDKQNMELLYHKDWRDLTCHTNKDAIWRMTSCMRTRKCCLKMQYLNNFLK